LAMEEYAALLGESDKRGLRVIPLVVGKDDPPPFAANRMWRWLRGIGDQAFATTMAEIAMTIRGEEPDPSGEWPEAGPDLGPIFRAKPRPLEEPKQRMLAVCYVEADQDYGQRLVRHLRGAGLPTWSVADIRPGEWHIWVTRQRLAYATAIIVLESRQAQESEDI